MTAVLSPAAVAAKRKWSARNPTCDNQKISKLYTPGDSSNRGAGYSQGPAENQDFNCISDVKYSTLKKPSIVRKRQAATLQREASQPVKPADCTWIHYFCRIVQPTLTVRPFAMCLSMYSAGALVVSRHSC